MKFKVGDIVRCLPTRSRNPVIRASIGLTGRVTEVMADGRLYTVSGGIWSVTLLADEMERV